MIMFIPVMGLGVIAARGIDILLDEEARRTSRFKKYLYGIISLPALLCILLLTFKIGQETWLGFFSEMIGQPTRYEQGPQLVPQRWNNLIVETGIAIGFASLYACVILACARKWLAASVIPLVLIAIYLADVGRINAKFMFLIDAPHKVNEVKSPLMRFLAREPKLFRVLPIDGSDPMAFVSNQIPVMFTSNAVQQTRWQNFMDNFNLFSSMPDMMNIKYLVIGAAQYEQQKAQLITKYLPVFQPAGGGQVVLENKSVLPKGWLVPAVAEIHNPQQTLGILRNPGFDPRRVAIVEYPPAYPMADARTGATIPAGNVIVTTYEGERISLTAKAPQNALLVLGEKYYRGWKVTVDGKAAEIAPVDYILRGVYLPPGDHKVEFIFDPLPYKVGKWLTLLSLAFFAVMLGREWLLRRRVKGEA
jgi:hypothetical protein